MWRGRAENTVIEQIDFNAMFIEVLMFESVNNHSTKKMSSRNDGSGWKQTT
jgi:hypothetical protein